MAKAAMKMKAKAKQEEADEEDGQEARRQAPLNERGSSVRRRPGLGTRAEQRTSSLSTSLRCFEAGDRDSVSGLRFLAPQPYSGRWHTASILWPSGSENEGAIVILVIMRPQTRRPIVLAAGLAARPS